MDHFYILLLNVKNIKLFYFHIHILMGIIMCNSCNILRTMEFILDILSSPDCDCICYFPLELFCLKLADLAGP